MENSTFKNPPALKLPVLGLSCPRDFFFFSFLAHETPPTAHPVAEEPHATT